ncbi:MAG: hypothetical protein ACYDEQ_03040 [Desulfocucumaceae bacterium]
MRDYKSGYSFISSLIEEYMDLVWIAVITFCAVCLIHFVSTLLFG